MQDWEMHLRASEEREDLKARITSRLGPELERLGYHLTDTELSLLLGRVMESNKSEERSDG